MISSGSNIRRGREGAQGVQGDTGADGADGATGPPGPAITTDPGEVLGTAIDGVTGPAAALTGLQLGSLLREGVDQFVPVSVGGGTGPGGVYTANDIQVNPETTNMLILPVGPGEVVFAGIGSTTSTGQTLNILWAGAGPGSTLTILHSSPDAGSPEAFFANPDQRDVSCSYGLGLLRYKNIFGGWFAADTAQNFTYADEEEGFVQVVDSEKKYIGRRLLTTDIFNSIILIQDDLSILDQFLSGSVYTLPDRAVVITDGQFVHVSNRRIVLGADSIFKGFGRVRDSHSFSTSFQNALVIPANPGAIEITDITLHQTGFGNDLIQTTDGNAVRIFMRNLEMFCGGRDAMSISAGVVDMASLNVRNCANGVTVNASCNVFALQDALILQTSGGSLNACVDLGSSSIKYSSPRLESVVMVAATGGTRLKIAAGNGNMVDGDAEGELLNCRFTGVGGTIEGGTSDDLQWMYVGNRGIRNSSYEGELSITTPVETVITDSSFTKVLGITTPGVLHRVIQSSNGVLEVTRLQEASYLACATLSASKGSAAAQLCNFQLFKDIGAGFVPFGAIESLSVTNTLKPVFIQALVDLTTGGRVELRMAGIDGTDNVTAASGSLIIRASS